MTTTAPDLIRGHREATARGEATDWGALGTEPGGIDEERADDPAGLWLRPRDALPGRAVLAVHGGGFISGSAATHRRMFGRAVALRARDSGLVPPAAMLLISAWVDLEATGGSYDTASDPFFTRELGSRASTSASTSSRGSCTRSRWRPAGRPLPTTRSRGPGCGCARR